MERRYLNERKRSLPVDMVADPWQSKSVDTIVGMVAPSLEYLVYGHIFTRYQLPYCRAFAIGVIDIHNWFITVRVEIHSVCFGGDIHQGHEGDSACRCVPKTEKLSVECQWFV
mgnify:CR=1 FL=1